MQLPSAEMFRFLIGRPRDADTSAPVGPVLPHGPAATFGNHLMNTNAIN